MKRTTLLLAIGLTIVLAVGIFFLKSSSAVIPASESKLPIAVKSIRILPLGPGCSPAFIQETQHQIRRFIPDAQLLKHSDLPTHAYYRPRSRYRADSLIHWMGRQAKPDQVILGITTVDISTTKGDQADWGVMGLGFCPGNAAVASSYRLKNKTAFWKVAIHELGHTAGLPHCSVKSCFMRDADGGNPTADETAFCPTCSDVLKKAGWRVESRELSAER